MNRPFDPALYKTYDKPGREALVSLLEQWGHEIQNVEENYNADITSTKDGKDHYSEAEIKTAWKGGWPEKWAEVRIPGRKARLLSKHDAVTFYVFSNDCSRCWVVRGDQLDSRRLKPAFGPNIYRGELFFHVPVNEIQEVRFAEDKWETV